MSTISKISLLFILLLVKTSYSQVVIDDTHINTPGNSLDRFVDTSGNINPGTAGSGQNWSFSFNKHEANHLSFLNPAALPLSSNFPTSNLALSFDNDNDSSWVFAEKSDTSFLVLGFTNVYEVDGVGDTVSEPYRAKILSFPSSIGTTFSFSNTEELIERYNIDPDGAGPHPNVDSIKTTFTLRGESEIDADGTVSLETCTYDAIRQFYTEYATDSTSMYANGSWQPLSTVMINYIGSPATSTDTYHLLRWWVNQQAIGFPIVECEADMNKNPIGQIDWVSNPCVGIEEGQKKDFALYPNPANEEVTILTLGESNSDLTFKLYTLNGKMVLSKNIGNESIKLPSLPDGTYMYQITDESSKILFTNQLIIIQ